MGISIELLLAVISAAATAIGSAATSGFFKTFLLHLLKKPSDDTAIVFSTSDMDSVPFSEFPGADIAIAQVRLRLTEARQAKVSQQNLAWVGAFASHLLTFGQYVVGGALASAFVQSNFSPKVIGLCGVVVLVSSLVNQHYHPEVKATESTRRMKELQTLIRDSEDRLALISAKLHANPNATQTLMELALQISSMLNAVDMAGTPKLEEMRILPVSPERA